MRQCSKPSCSASASVLLGYSYAEQLVTLDDAPETGEVDPHLYVFCSRCADALTPPKGWELDDRRARPPLFLADYTRPDRTLGMENLA